MNDAITIIFYVILAIVGFVCLYNGYEMKVKGNLKIGWFVGQDIKKEKCKDVPGFIEATLKPIFIFGVVTVVGSIAMIIIEGLGGPKYIQMVILLALIVLFFWFNSKINKATTTYLK